MKHLVLRISYDGTNYYGFQVQENLPTIQGKIEDTLKNITKEKIRIRYAGRTDRKVHAFWQVVDFFTEWKRDVNEMINAMNALLPEDIRVLEGLEVRNDFHSRFDAKRRQYTYIVFRGNTLLPFFRNYAYLFSYSLDLNVMRKSSNFFLGEHDFGTLCDKSDEENFTRTIEKVEILNKGSFFIFRIVANAFLKGMVRYIVQILLDVGRCKLKLKDVEYIIASKRKWKKVSPKGLYLSRVWYD
jgi:tRNA pseudouridine38-40 synthase